MTKEEAIDINKLTLWQILHAITVSQAYKMASTMTVMIMAVFWSGYQTAEYNHRQEKLRSEMFQAMTEMWEAANAHAEHPAEPAFKIPRPLILNHSMPVAQEDIEYLKAKRKLQNVMQQQNAIGDHKWELAKNKRGDTVIRSDSSKEFVLPKLDQNVKQEPQIFPESGGAEAAPPPEPIDLTPNDEAHKEIASEPENKSYTSNEPVFVIKYLPYMVPAFILILVWGIVIRSRRTNSE